MKRLGRYDPDASYVVRRSFTYNGEQMNPGDPIEITNPHRGRQLYTSRYIDVADSEDMPEDEVDTFGASDEVTDQTGEDETVEDEHCHDDDDDDDGDDDTPDNIEIVSRGHGYYDVVVDGEPINDAGMRRKAARQLVKEITGDQN